MRMITELLEGADDDDDAEPGGFASSLGMSSLTMLRVDIMLVVGAEGVEDEDTGTVGGVPSLGLRGPVGCEIVVLVLEDELDGVVELVL